MLEPANAACEKLCELMLRHKQSQTVSSDSCVLCTKYAFKQCMEILLVGQGQPSSPLQWLYDAQIVYTVSQNKAQVEKVFLGL